jgi:hypothetical protein
MAGVYPVGYDSKGEATLSSLFIGHPDKKKIPGYLL